MTLEVAADDGGKDETGAKRSATWFATTIAQLNRRASPCNCEPSFDSCPDLSARAAGLFGPERSAR